MLTHNEEYVNPPMFELPIDPEDETDEAK